MIDPFKSRGFWKDFDWLLLGAALLLSLISITEIYSSTMNFYGTYYLFRQLAWVCAGIVLMFAVASIDYRLIVEHVPWMYLASLAVLLYTRLTAREIAGARSWIEVGPVSFQPSEFIKMVVVVAMARYLADLHVDRHMTLSQILRAGMICGLPVGFVLLQPDLGTSLTYMPVMAVGIFLRGVKPAALIAILLICVLFGVGSWSFLKDYQKDRVLTFMDPERKPQGAGYQVIQSRIAIGSGGLLGKGLFNGTQNQLGFLPTSYTDFIFSVVGEEMGFLGVIITLGLLGFILLRSIYHAQTARDNLGLFIVMGVVGIFFFHIVVNVAMVIGFMPVTGIPLPFMSYGGSSILTAFIGLGLVISVRRGRYVN
jgi:rod shape determining protein RodA